MTYPTIHGHYFEPEYQTWKNMLARCDNNPWYAHVQVCDAWRESYAAFLADVGHRPSPEMTLDRIDPTGNYEPGNVRWATRAIQSRNTRVHCTNKTGVRGVSWSKQKSCYRAQISVDNRSVHLGYFDTIEDAKLARKNAEGFYWGRDD